MSAAPAAVPDPPVKDFTITRSRRVVTFTLEGHPLTAREPKTAWQLAQIKKYEGMDAESAYLLSVDETLEKVFDTESLAHLRGRLDDDDDDFDVEDLVAISRWLREQWSGDPTGSPTGSSRRSSRTGGRSTARRH